MTMNGTVLMITSLLDWVLTLFLLCGWLKDVGQGTLALFRWKRSIGGSKNRIWTSFFSFSPAQQWLSGWLLFFWTAFWLCFGFAADCMMQEKRWWLWIGEKGVSDAPKVACKHYFFRYFFRHNSVLILHCDNNQTFCITNHITINAKMASMPVEG